MTRFLFLLLLILVTAARAETPKEVPARINQVTIFFNGAQVSRSATTTLPAGKSQIVFKNISQYVRSQSLQVKGEGRFTVLSVVHQQDQLREQTKRTEIATLETAREKIEDQLKREQNLLQVYQSEEAMLTKNQEVKGLNASLSVSDLRQAVDFHRSRLTEIKTLQQETNKNIQKLSRDLTRHQQQLQNLHAQNNTGSSEILVSVTAPVATTATFQVSYLVEQASWHPTYDLRVTDISKPINLSSKANVTQQSGEDWREVKLTLSTANPSQSGLKPELQTWLLQYGRPVPPYARMGRLNELQEVVVTGSGLQGRVAGVDAESAASIRIRGAQKTLQQASAPVEVTTRQNQTSLSFDIALPYTIPSDGKSYAVEIKEQTIPATYEYLVTPKLDRDAFLTANIINWETYGLLAGEASLFFEGTFLGKTFLNTDIVSDTLAISLGRDKNIVVNRVKVKEENRRQFLGNSRTETISWEISIRNKKNLPVRLVVEDQIPVSTVQEIEVNLLSSPGAGYDKQTGKLTWRLDLAPGKEEKLTFKYSVKYPRSQRVVLE